MAESNPKLECDITRVERSSTSKIRISIKYSLIVLGGMVILSIGSVLVSNIAGLNANWLLRLQNTLNNSSGILFMWRCFLYISICATSYLIASKKTGASKRDNMKEISKYVAWRLFGYCIFFELFIVQNSLGIAYKMVMN